MGGRPNGNLDRQAGLILGALAGIIAAGLVALAMLLVLHWKGGALDEMLGGIIGALGAALSIVVSRRVRRGRSG